MRKIAYSAVKVCGSPLMRLRRGINCVGSMQDTLATNMPQEAMNPIYNRYDVTSSVMSGLLTTN